jgi:PAS domain S-box-containing protein
MGHGTGAGPFPRSSQGGCMAPMGDVLSIPPCAGAEEPGAERLFHARYRVVRPLKTSQGIETLLAHDELTGEQVVIKAVCGESFSLAVRMRLEHEAQVLRQIRSPWCAPLLHLGREDDRLYLVLPFLPGVTLEQRLRRGPLSVADTLTVGRSLLGALGDAHEYGVLHRDLKPANIIVDCGPACSTAPGQLHTTRPGEDGPLERATLIDFGLARSACLDASIRDQPVGTARYMSPEQAGLLDQGVDERSDLYAAGVVLFECLAGRPPFTGASVGEVLRQHLTVPAPQLRALGVAVPRALDEVIQRLLRKDPRDRYQSAAAAAADLEAIARALAQGEEEPALVVGLHDRRRALTEPAFVGRAEHLLALDAQVERVRGGQGGLVLLEAISGGGKTRLLAELAQRCTQRGLWVLRGQGLDQVGQRPFQPLAGVVAAVAEAARTERELAAAIRHRLGDQLEAACAALPELADALEARVSGQLGPEKFGQARSLEALAALLDSLGTEERPALVLLDDCQWFDELMLKLVAHWKRRRKTGQPCHLLLVAAFRSEEVQTGHPLRNVPAELRLSLPPFGAEDVRQLAESIAGPLPVEALEVVQRLSEGSPFMTVAVLQGLVESGALVGSQAGWHVEASAMAGVQSSRHAAAFLTSRLELLPAASLHLLSVGAVLGKDFDLHLAATLAGQAPGEAVAALDEARRRHIVWARPQDNQAVFIHDRLRQALLERLPAAERRELHLRAALELERRGDPCVFSLAYHFDAAGESGRALPHALAAAEQARAQHSLEIAAQQYRIAGRGAQLDDKVTRWQGDKVKDGGSAAADPSGTRSPCHPVTLSPCHPIRYHIAEGLGEVLMLQGRYDEAREQLEEASRLAPDNVVRARVEGKLGELAFKRGDIRTAWEGLERALRQLGRIVPRGRPLLLLMLLWEVGVQVLHTFFPRLFLGRRSLAGAEQELLAVRLYNRLAYVYWFGRGVVPALWTHLRGMNLAERYPPTPELAQAYSEHGPGTSLLAWYRRGLAYVEKSLVIRRALGDVWGQGQSLHFDGVVLYASSRFTECIDRCREAVRLLRRTGDFWEVNIARYQIAAGLYRQGDLRGALEEARSIYRSGRELGDSQASGIILDVWAWASGGRVPADIVQLEMSRPSKDVQRAAQVLVAEGVRLLGEGKPAEAADTLEEAHRRLRQADVLNAWVSPVLPWLATARRRQLEALPDRTPGRRRILLRQLRRTVRQALRWARSFQNELPHALREAALLAALEGGLRRSRRLFDEGLRVAARQGARYEHAQTLLARGQVGLEAGWAGAAEDIEEARRFPEWPMASEEWGEQTGSETPPAARQGQAAKRPVTLSLVDRFDTVLDAGRGVASALTREAVGAAVREACLRLFRGEQCLVLELSPGEGDEVSVSSSQLQGEYSRSMVRRAVARGRAVAFVEGLPDSTSESLLLSGARSSLCAPIFVRGRPVACFCVTHRQVGRLFGEDEERLADFVATLAGAALENAENFAELRRLNETLELRIKERKQAEEQIKEQAALLDKAQDAILVQDLQGRVLFWNRSAERLYGWTAAEAAGRNANELLFGSPYSPLGEALRTVLQKGEWTGELQQVTRTGEKIVVESRWALVRDDEGRPKAQLIVNTNVTEKKKIEAQFLRSQRMESIGTLAGGIAHDLNNVLTPILMAVELLRTSVPEAARKEVLASIEASAERGAEMVRQILSFARGVEGRRVLLQLKHLVRDLEKVLGSTLPKSIVLETRLPRDLWVLPGDPTQLYQVLMNLCVNARDAMPQGGRLTITAENVVLDETRARVHPDGRPGRFIRLVVADTGVGIPPGVLDRIFEPFFTTKEIGKGTGLGLATVLGIVKSHDGFISVTSEVGRGTAFSVYLPAAEEPSAGRDEGKQWAVQPGNGELILVVDDEAPIREMAATTLAAHGYRVQSAREGKEALALYARHRGEVGLVLTDLMMPTMDGPATIRALRQLDPGVAILATSGLAETAPPGEAQAFLPKPFTAHGLLSAVRQVLEKKTPPVGPEIS